jgi:HAD superfamily hydrolase (TIGR01509 family)
MPLPPTADAVIFDCDGLLVETESGWTRAETAIFAAHGFGFGAEQKELLIGRTLPAAGAAMAGYFGRPGDGSLLARRLYDLVAVELAAGADALPGAREIILRARERVPVAVASNSPRAFVDAALASAGLDGLVEHILAAEDVVDGKPAPDLYLAACAALGADPARSVAFEDSATGVASAPGRRYVRRRRAVPDRRHPRRRRRLHHLGRPGTHRLGVGLTLPGRCTELAGALNWPVH